MQKKQTSKPELLLPVGNIEAFYAALEAKADAIYLGLRSFNARSRASNFSPWQLGSMIKIARKNKVKVYITLNTVIKNGEINKLADTLFVLSQIKPDAIIIQDWGVYFLARRFFPALELHASTQMGNHNSAGVAHAAQMGFERVVLARELTRTELEQIATKKQCELELFIHGALCYSFSGMCLFSSFLGGAGANRGLCAQPCRRIYTRHKEESYFFSLKDNQLIDQLPYIQQLGIDSLKVEGRMKPAEYVFQVGTAYRQAIDDPKKRETAKALLNYDLGREKTEYFLGKKVNDAITQSANTGLFLGTVSSVVNETVTFESELDINPSCRLRFRNKTDDRQSVINVGQLERKQKRYTLTTSERSIQPGDEVYLAGLKLKFHAKIKTDGIKINDRCPKGKLNQLRNTILHKKSNRDKITVYLRVDSLDWLKLLHTEDFHELILNLSRSEWEKFNPRLSFIQKNKQHLWIELPKFIPEGTISFYKEQLQKMKNSGINNFSISHLSQISILPKDARFISNENVYLFNDAAIQVVKELGATAHIYPLENDIVNLSKGSDREGIIPMYIYPHLFYSRMPVKAEKEEYFSDKTGERFRKIVRDGITMVVPEKPVSLLQYRSKLERYGFSRYLIDLSTITPTRNLPGRIKKHLLQAQSLQSASNFNFKRELK